MAQTPVIVMTVKSVKRGPIPDDGTMATILTSIGDTLKGTVQITIPAPTTFDVNVEEKDDPVFQFLTKGKKQVKLSLIDFDPAALVLVLGGSVADDGMWEEPDNAPIIEESYQIITQTGYIFEIPRASVQGAVNGQLKKDGVASIDVMLTPLQPAAAGVKTIRSGVYQAPTVDAGAPVNPAADATVANLAGTATAFRGTLTYQWTLKSKPNGAAAPVLATPTALNCALSVLTTKGAYVFTLTATDSNGFSASDDVTVTTS